MTGTSEAIILAEGDWRGSWGGNSLIMKGGSITSDEGGGIRFSNGGRGDNGNSVTLEDVNIDVAGRYGISSFRGKNSYFKMLGGTISYRGDDGNAVTLGAGNNFIDGTKIISDGIGISVESNDANNHSFLDLRNFYIETSDRIAVSNKASVLYGIVGLEIETLAAATVQNGTIITHGKKGHGIYRPSSISEKTKALPFSVAQVDVTTFGQEAHALFHYDGQTTIKESSLTAKGENSFALKFSNPVNRTGKWASTGKQPTATVDIDNSVLSSQQSVAVVLNGGEHTLNIRNGSSVKGDALVATGGLDEIGAPAFGRGLYEAHLTLNADKSYLAGAAYVTDDTGPSPWLTAQLTMNLANNTIWEIHPSLTAKHWASDKTAAFGTQSEVSFLKVDNSHIVFNPLSTGLYQSLTVGSGWLDGREDVYQAAGKAQITLNVGRRVAGGHRSDRLLINGDVDGQTALNIRTLQGVDGVVQDISLIQASGQAAADSFVLNGGYATLAGKPYSYGLYAYGPTSTRGLADESQREVEGTDPHWDWRLQNMRVSNGGYASVTAQVSNYLLATPSLFHAGMFNISTLNRRIGDMRAQIGAGDGAQLRFDDDKGKARGNFFLRGFGGDYSYHSNLSADQYGYDGDIRYAGLQMGGSLTGFETNSSAMQFGLAGSYSKLAFTPDSVAYARKSDMNLWNISPYMTWLHQSGFYADIVLNYGRFSGDVATDLRGRTAKLKGYSQAASLEVGMPFALPVEGLTLEPQAQITYQQLHFDETRDIDGFPIIIGQPEQWTVRLGSKLEKHFFGEANPSDVKLYGKLNLLHSFGDKHTVWLGDSFKSGRSGTQIELGAGLDVVVADKVNVYTDLSWQERVSSGGTSGLSLNGGLKVNF